MAKLLRNSVMVIFIVGNIVLTEPRAVNISNMWTLPQEGFSVFYRYFRDKITWLEADAVCQFHHANLVTVDNGVQFDATRAFLKELDVTNAVWIGLKRPQNSLRFAWTSSKTLDPSSGYWAETIPAIQQPLCTVVDPIRDFRWHAFRCGGPETAAFLCELPVPTWAMDCTVTSIPSLTVQYMSDSGIVQLSRDCGESGTKHISCQGKHDRKNIIEQLQCNEEENLASVLATDSSNELLLMHGRESVTTAATSTSRPQPPILEHDILTVVSSIDQESNNKIAVNTNQIEDTVKNVINKFNLLDPMSSEEAGLHNNELNKADHMVKCQRKSGYNVKISPLYEKKNRIITKKTYGSNWNESGNEEDESDETMMGDQPVEDVTEIEPIDIIQQAVKSTVDGDYSDPELLGSVMKTMNNEREDNAGGDTRVAWTEIVTTPDSRLRRETVSERDEGAVVKAIEPVHVSNAFDIKMVSETTISNPHFISSVSPVMTVTEVSPGIVTAKTTTASYILPTTSKIEIITGDHFIPPMLLVKARFISARPKTGSSATTMLPNVMSTNIPVKSRLLDSLPAAFAKSDATFPEYNQKNVPVLSKESTSSESVVDALQDNILSVPIVPQSMTDFRQIIRATVEKNQSLRSEPLGMLITGKKSLQTGMTTDEQLPINHENYYPSQAAAIMSSIHLTQYEGFIKTTAASFPDITEQISNRPKPEAISTNIKETALDTPQVKEINESSTLMSPATAVSVSRIIPHSEPIVFSRTVNTTTTLGEINYNSSHDEVFSTENPKRVKSIDETPYLYHKTTVAVVHNSMQNSNNTHMNEQHTECDEEKHSELNNSFSNVENYQPYKPNRHRTLTKSEFPFDLVTSLIMAIAFFIS